MLEPGRAVSHDRISDTVCRGEMGEVGRARDERLGREVALKVLPGHFARGTVLIENWLTPHTERPRSPVR